MTKNTYGTGSFVLMNVGPTCPAPVEGLLTTVAWQLGGRRASAYAYEGRDLRRPGAAVQWLRDGLGVIDAGRRDRAAGRDRPRHRWRLRRPRVHRASAARGGTRRPGARSSASPGARPAPTSPGPSLEAMAFQTRDVVDAMSRGVGSRRWPCCGPTAARRPSTCSCSSRPTSSSVPVARPVIQETTALGAAYLAGLAEGVWSSPDELAGHWRLDVGGRAGCGRGGAPTLATPQWLRAVERSRGWATE